MASGVARATLATPLGCVLCYFLRCLRPKITAMTPITATAPMTMPVTEVSPVRAVAAAVVDLVALLEVVAFVPVVALAELLESGLPLAVDVPLRYAMTKVESLSVLAVIVALVVPASAFTSPSCRRSK